MLVLVVMLQLFYGAYYRRTIQSVITHRLETYLEISQFASSKSRN